LFAGGVRFVGRFQFQQGSADPSDGQAGMPRTTHRPTIRPVRDGLVAAFGHLMAALIGIVGLWWVSDAHLRIEMQESLIRVASAAAAVVDGNLHSSLNTPEQMDGEDYDRCIAPLRKIYTQLDGVKFLYTAILDGDTVRFVLDTAAPGDNDGDGVEDRSCLWSVYEEADDVLRTALREGRPIADNEPFADRWGTFISGYAPIRNGNGQVVGVVGADMAAETYLGHLAAARHWAVLGLLPAVVVSFLAGVVTYRLRQRAQRDAEERLRQERALQENSRRLEHERGNLQAMFDAAEVGMLLIDENAEVIRVNTIAAQLVGTDAAELLQRRAGSVLGCVYAARAPLGCGRTEECPLCPIRHSIQRVLRTHEAVRNIEVERTLLAGGHARSAWLSVSATSVTLDGKPHALLAIADITERKRVEDDMRESEARLKIIVDSLQAGVVLIDRETHTVVDANPAALGMLRAPRAAVIGHICHKFICPAEHGRCPVTDVGEAVDNSERTVLTADGRRVSVLKTVVPVTLKGHDYLLESFVDISDRKRAEGELAAHRERLEELVRERTQKLMEAERQVLQGEKLASVGRLAAGVAHEINTPIQYIGDNLRALADFYEDIRMVVGQYRELVRLVAAAEASPETAAKMQAAEEEHDLEFILEDAPKAVSQGLEGVQRVANIVRAMKDFSHVRGGEVSNVDLNHCLQSTLTVARNEYKYVADVETDFAELPNVECYPGELNQVFLNILVNAAHAIQDTGQRGKITVMTRVDGEQVEIAIADTGVGIPEEIRNKIYEPFFTTKEVGRGTGQGLSIAHQTVVGVHGGQLSCESTVGVGTTFRIRLPLRLAAKARMESDADHE
jgi:PAS domain S-box-containing protein